MSGMTSFNKQVFSELLQKAIGNRSLNEYARQAEVSNSYISNLINCKKDNPPEGKTIKKLADAAHNNVTYFEFLEAAGLLTPEIQEKVERLTELKKWSIEYENARTTVQETTKRVNDAALEVKEAEAEYRLLQELAKENKIEKAVQFIRVPLLGNIAAGLPIFASEQVVDFEYFPKAAGFEEGDLFALRVKGDSMIGARIYDGDKVIVKVQPEVEDGEIAVVNVDGDNATLKRVKHINGNVLLISDNPNYEPIVINSESARICGKVISVMFNPNAKK
jgi:SOS regulatory protein LexA